MRLPFISAGPSLRRRLASLTLCFVLWPCGARAAHEPEDGAGITSTNIVAEELEAEADSARETADTPALKGTLLEMVRRLHRRLELSAGQEDRLKAILEQARPRVEALLARDLEIRERLRELVEADEPEDGRIREVAADLSGVEVELCEERAAIMAAVSEELSAPQRALVVRFDAAVDEQAHELERHAALPGSELEDMHMSEKRKDEAMHALELHRSAVESAFRRSKTARAALLAAVHQPALDSEFVTEVAKVTNGSRVDMAAGRARALRALRDTLGEKKREQVKRIAAAADRGVVRRHRVRCVLFLQLL